MLRGLPLTPMRRTNVDPLLVCCFDPSAEDAAAGEDEGVRLTFIEYGQFKVAIEGRGRYELPLHLVIFGSKGIGYFDLDHLRGGLVNKTSAAKVRSW